MANDKPATESPLTRLAAENDIVIVADENHADSSTLDSIRRQLPELSQKGVRHLFVEVDPADVSVELMLKQPHAFGNMLKEADKQDVKIHFIDDKSHQRAVDQKYATEAKLVASEKDENMRYYDE